MALDKQAFGCGLPNDWLLMLYPLHDFCGICETVLEVKLQHMALAHHYILWLSTTPIIITCGIGKKNYLKISTYSAM